MKKVGLRRWEGALMAGFAIALLLPLIGGKAQGELADKVIRLHVLAHSDDPRDQALKLSVRDAVLAYLQPVITNNVQQYPAVCPRVTDTFEGSKGGVQGVLGSVGEPLGSDGGCLGSDGSLLGADRDGLTPPEEDPACNPAPLGAEGVSRQRAEALLVSHLSDIQKVAQEVVAQAGYDYPVTVSLEENVSFPTKEYGSFSFPAGGYTALRVVIGDGGGQNWWCVVFPPLCMASAADPLTQAAAVGSLDGEDVALITEDGPEYVLKFKAAEWWQSLNDWWAGR